MGTHHSWTPEPHQKSLSRGRHHEGVLGIMPILLSYGRHSFHSPAITISCLRSHDTPLTRSCAAFIQTFEISLPHLTCYTYTSHLPHFLINISYLTLLIYLQTQLSHLHTMAHTNSPTRRPLESQRNLGADMSMMFFVRPQLPRKFSSPDQQLVKGLNVETIASVNFPTPSWLDDFNYRALMEQSDGEPSREAYFSLNIALYDRPLSTPDWEGLLFFFTARVHPYALTWEVTSTDDGDTSEYTQHYTIPAITVRDNGYYP
jgi:hypothetical protein